MEPTTERELRKLGRTIRAARERAGVSQEEFAAAADVDRAYMSRIEQGQANLTWALLSRIALALGVRPSGLIAAAGL